MCDSNPPRSDRCRSGGVYPPVASVVSCWSCNGPSCRKEAHMGEISNIISAFSADHVIRLTGLTMGQLTYWDRTGFFKPQYGADERRSPYSRIYSFSDVVGLRTLSVLKKKFGVSLPHLRQVAGKLSAYSKTPWADITL